MGKKYVVASAQIKCSFGQAPAVLNVIKVPLRPMYENKPAASIMDMIPMVNIMPFGMCQSMANPQVASATAAAMGVLTPMPCIPAISAPWTPAGKRKYSGEPALLENCKCMCMWGGQIEITNPGQNSVTED